MKTLREWADDTLGVETTKCIEKRNPEFPWNDCADSLAAIWKARVIKQLGAI